MGLIMPTQPIVGRGSNWLHFSYYWLRA